MSDRTPPNDIPAEACVLGACLLSTQALDEVRVLLTGADFYHPAHGIVWNTITAVADRGDPIDVVTVVAALRENGEINQAGGALGVHALVESVPTAANVGYYARIVRDRSVLRSVISAGTKAVQLGENPAGQDGYAVAEQAADMLVQVRDRGLLDEDLPTLNIEEFLSVEIKRNWIIPGLLERGDRLMLTGGEGLGKSEIGRQVAVCVASGLHPFTHGDVPVGKVLVVDLENPMALTQRRYQRLIEAARKHDHPVDPSRLWIEARPAGLDIAQAADMRWLLRRVELLQPDLLVVGPIYRMHTSDPNDEQTARRVAAVLDRCRATAGCALITENHSPHGSGMVKHRPVRPVGSSLWLRWPEFGYGIRLADENGAHERRLVDVVPWRGPREERQWPERLESGHPWSWMEAYPAGFDPVKAGVA